MKMIAQLIQNWVSNTRFRQFYLGHPIGSQWYQKTLIKRKKERNAHSLTATVGSVRQRQGNQCWGPSKGKSVPFDPSFFYVPVLTGAFIGIRGALAHLFFVASPDAS
jgi:hypothetical protein